MKRISTLATGERVYNVRVALVDLVIASSEEEAIALMVRAIDAAGLTALDDGHNAFESEPLATDVTVLTSSGRARLRTS